MAVLAEAYIHLKPFYISEERLEQLGHRIDEIARVAALEFYEWPVEIEVELIEGTLWGKIKVAGTVFVTGVTLYSSIDGVLNTTERLCKSANLFGDLVCSQFIKEAGATKEQVQRVERRLKTPGKLRRALQRVKRLDETAAKMKPEELQRQLHRARLELEAAMKELDGEDEGKLREALQFRNLPPLNKWPDRNEQLPDVPRIARREDDAQLTFGRQEMLIEGTPARVPARRPLRYHSRFVVSPPAKRTGEGEREPPLRLP
jgi:hypothetical protein